ARPVRHSIRGWQARRHAEKAISLIEAQQWSAARDEATAAYQLQPREPKAVRAVALLLSRAGQADGLEFWKSLADLTPLTPDDLREEARLALRVNDVARASDAARQLMSTSAPAPGDCLIAAEVALRKESFTDAHQLAERVLSHDRASRRERLQAIVLLANISAPAKLDATEVDHLLAELSKGSDEISLDALVVLAERALANRSSAPAGNSLAQIATAIDSHPLAKAAQKLIATDLEIAQRPERREQIISGAIERWKNAGNDSLVALAAWLYRNREYERLIKAIPLDRALQSRELFLQHVDALAALGRWNEIRKIIEAERFPLDPVIEHMYLARCFAQQGEQNGAENNWQRALEAAAGDPAKLLMLGEYAEKNDALEVARKAFSAACAAAPKLRAAQQGRLRVAYRKRDTGEIRAVLSDLLRIWPNDPAVQNDAAYIRLLQLPNDEPANPELNKIEAEAERLVSQEPQSLPHRTLLALARLKQGRPEAALAVYDGIKVAPNAASSSAVAVHAAVLNATGHPSEAHAEISRVRAGQLLPEEEAGTANLHNPEH
ncbi:MAG: hypothetical protein JO354_11305, partial [Verrucomicrobia bacterium]|nr:hypothetical protein [Verrucomicrobiota bacterium]